MAASVVDGSAVSQDVRAAADEVFQHWADELQAGQGEPSQELSTLSLRHSRVPFCWPERPEIREFWIASMQHFVI